MSKRGAYDISGLPPWVNGLAQLYDDCSKRRGGCDNCADQDQCMRKWDKEMQNTQGKDLRPSRVQLIGLKMSNL